MKRALLSFICLIICCIASAKKYDKLPDWFFNPPQSTKDVTYAIGISDPGMNREKAFKLATVRTRILCTILNNSVVESQIKGNHCPKLRLSTINYKIASKTDGDAHFSVIRKYFTPNGEAIMLGKLQCASLLPANLKLSATVNIFFSSIFDRTNEKDNRTSYMELMSSISKDSGNHHQTYIELKSYFN